MTRARLREWITAALCAWIVVASVTIIVEILLVDHTTPSAQPTVTIATPVATSAPTPTAMPERAVAGRTLTPDTPGLHGPRLDDARLFGLALYVSGDPSWSQWMVGVVKCESDGRVGAVGRDPGGQINRGLTQLADVHAPRVDMERVRRDPVLAMTEAYVLYQQSGAGAWGCGR